MLSRFDERHRFTPSVACGATFPYHRGRLPFIIAVEFLRNFRYLYGASRVSLRLGRSAALTTHCVVIHYRLDRRALRSPSKFTKTKRICIESDTYPLILSLTITPVRSPYINASQTPFLFII